MNVCLGVGGGSLPRKCHTKLAVPLTYLLGLDVSVHISLTKHVWGLGE